jgi:hypothetical protein
MALQELLVCAHADFARELGHMLLLVLLAFAAQLCGEELTNLY